MCSNLIILNHVKFKGLPIANSLDPTVEGGYTFRVCGKMCSRFFVGGKRGGYVWDGGGMNSAIYQHGKMCFLTFCFIKK